MVIFLISFVYFVAIDFYLEINSKNYVIFIDKKVNTAALK